MRCDANISVREKGEKKLGTRVEVKNLNSIRNVKKAIEFEAARLIAIVESGQAVQQETRSFDANNGTTFSLRTKEDADDYRYFPEPDLTPFHISEEFLEEMRSSLPALPEELEKRFITEYQLSAYDAGVICDDREQASFFESTAALTQNRKAVANWMLGPIKNYLNETGTDINRLPLSAETLARLIELTDSGLISFNNASSKIFQALLESPATDPLEVAKAMNLLQESSKDSLDEWVNKVIAKMPDKVKEYQSGKKGLMGLFAGEVKKLSKGKADMQAVNRILEEKLKTT